MLRQSVVAFLVLASSASAFGHARNWHDVTGKYSLKAEYVQYSSGNVTLKKLDGSTVSVPISKLSDADLDFIAKRILTDVGYTGISASETWKFDNRTETFDSFRSRNDELCIESTRMFAGQTQRVHYLLRRDGIYLETDFDDTIPPVLWWPKSGVQAEAWKQQAIIGDEVATFGAEVLPLQSIVIDNQILRCQRVRMTVSNGRITSWVDQWHFDKIGLVKIVVNGDPKQTSLRQDIPIQ